MDCEAGIKQHLVSPQTYAKRLYIAQGANEKDWSCLQTLWTMESSWRVKASGSMTTQGRAYGIPQALPATKMERMGTDWQTNYQTQIRWGLLYIKLHWQNKACLALKNELNKGYY